jgi:predicted transcriptional regulator
MAITTSSLHRRRLQIVAEILYLAQSPVKKTRLLYDTNMSYPHLSLYLEMLRGLLEYVPEKRLYRTTDEGTKEAIEVKRENCRGLQAF